MSLPDLPDFRNTEHAIAFGQHMTRDQFVMLSGARDALQREFDRIKASYDGAHRGDPAMQQIMADLATTIGKMREALEVAPNLILASTIGGDIVTPSMTRRHVFEPIQAANLGRKTPNSQRGSRSSMPIRTPARSVAKQKPAAISITTWLR